MVSSARSRLRATTLQQQTLRPTRSATSASPSKTLHPRTQRLTRLSGSHHHQQKQQPAKTSSTTNSPEAPVATTSPIPAPTPVTRRTTRNTITSTTISQVRVRQEKRAIPATPQVRRTVSEKVVSRCTSLRRVPAAVTSQSASTSEETTTKKEDEGIKTRRVQKIKIETGPKCTLCKNVDGTIEEDLHACVGCAANYHLSKCLKYKPDFVSSIKARTGWLCARCVRCRKCAEFISDPTNVECWSCFNAWHGSCAPKGHSTTQFFDGPWFCNTCSKKRGYITSPSIKKTTRMESHPSTSSPVERPVEPKKRAQKRPRKESGEIRLSTSQDELSQIINKRTDVWDKLMDIAGLGSPTKYAAHALRSSDRAAGQSGSPAKIRSLTRAAANKSGQTPSPVKMCITPKKSAGPSSLKRGILLPRSPLKKIDRLVTNFDSSLYSKVCRIHEKDKRVANEAEEARIANQPPNEQWVYFGNKKACKALCQSAYTEELKDAPEVYVCIFCLHASGNRPAFVIHWENCQWRCPPGNEIYRDKGLSFFEVDGAVEKPYCRNLCLMAKLFISSKTLHHEVETFLFYILCEHTPQGLAIVGYFSKEKNPSKNNNLSCLLTLPNAQRMGYGRLLIDMSYALSRLELKIGSPEHPLSDLGILAYRGYWRSSILCYLRSLRAHQHISIKEICLHTRIHPNDVVNQMLKDNLLVYRKGTYYIKTGKRAYKYALSQTRRRAIDTSKLIWKPNSDDVANLDPFRLNYYV